MQESQEQVMRSRKVVPANMNMPQQSRVGPEVILPRATCERSRLPAKGHPDKDHSGILCHEKRLQEPQIAANDCSLQHNTTILGTDLTQTSGEASTPMMFWIVSKLSVGPIVSTIFYMIVLFINAYYIGQTKNSVLISGVGMGNMLINLLGLSILQGLNSAIETLVSQCYGSSLNLDKSQEYRDQMRRSCGVYLNRGRFVITVALVPIGLFYWNSETVLLALHQDAEVARIACKYSTIMIPGLWSLSQFDSTKKFLSAQRKNHIPVWVQLFTTILHFFMCQKLIGEYKMNEVGAAIASDITYTLNMVLTDALIAYY